LGMKLPAPTSKIPHPQAQAQAMLEAARERLAPSASAAAMRPWLMIVIDVPN